MQLNDCANGNFLFCKYLAERCICECYACDANVWTNTHGSSKIHYSIFIQKQVILFNLEFQWSSSKTLPSKIILVFRKVWLNEPRSISENLIWNEMYESFFLVWLMNSQSLSTMKRFLFWWISNKFNFPFKSWI